MHLGIVLLGSLALVYRALSHKSLTLVGILAAFVTAIIHGLHPSPVPFSLLILFYLLGTRATKVKHEYKSRLTLSTGGVGGGGEGPRSSRQVLSNSIVASLLVLLNLWKMRIDGSSSADWCFAYGRQSQDVYLIGIIAQYAAVTADTLSSELGILSTAPPRLILSLDLRPVPRGTNGGVTVKGLIAGAMGAGVIGAASCALLSECPLAGEQEGIASKLCTYAAWTSIAAVWGTLGSLLDSVLGATLQASVVDVQSGKVIEGQSGKKVRVPAVQASKKEGLSEKLRAKLPARKIATGRDILSNNDVNLLMAAIMGAGGMIVACNVWGTSW